VTETRQAVLSRTLAAAASDRASLARELYDAAIHGADPALAVREALANMEFAPAAPVWILALGKAAHPMAASAVSFLSGRGIAPAGGLIVGAIEESSPLEIIEATTGEHPLPGTLSFAAAERIGALAERVGDDDEVLVLLSGGASSLAAAPVDGVETEDLVRLNQMLLDSGADVIVMNSVRKRFTRWSAGRLARALAPARVRCLIVSDVPGDDPTFIASGPCSPDPLTATDVEALLDETGLASQVPHALRDYLAGVIGGEIEETPKPGDPAFARVERQIVLANPHALSAAAARATELGVMPVYVAREPLADDAALTGARLAEELIRFQEGGLLGVRDPARFACMLWGGETTVTIGATGGAGGRCQELALSAARALHAANERGRGITLLAAGTDGRDGPTDAAGAIVDAETWDRIRTAGVDPDDSLSGHDAFTALRSVNALIVTGASGTNVRDIVIGIVTRD
jgi:glycerate 2-kinase